VRLQQLVARRSAADCGCVHGSGVVSRVALCSYGGARGCGGHRVILDESANSARSRLRLRKWCIDHRVIRPRSYAASDAGRASSVPWRASGNLAGWTLLRASALMYRRCSAHSSVCSMSSEPMRRMMAARSGKMPTTSVRRRISLFKRSSRVGTPDLAPELLREVPEGQQVTTGLLEVVSSLRQLGCERLGAPLELKL